MLMRQSIYILFVTFANVLIPSSMLTWTSSLSVQVMQVVREQIMRALTVKPNSLDQFKSRLQNLSYTEILKIRQSERMNQEDFQSRPILWVSLSNSLVFWLGQGCPNFSHKGPYSKSWCHERPEFDDDCVQFMSSFSLVLVQL